MKENDQDRDQETTCQSLVESMETDWLEIMNQSNSILVVLQKTTDFSSLPLYTRKSEPWKSIVGSYQKLKKPLDAAYMSILNAIYTQERAVFAITRDLLGELVRDDLNHDFGFSNKNYRSALSVLTNCSGKITKDPIAKELVRGDGSAPSIYMVTNKTILKYLQDCGVDTNSQIKDSRDFVEKARVSLDKGEDNKKNAVGSIKKKDKEISNQDYVSRTEWIDMETGEILNQDTAHSPLRATSRQNTNTNKELCDTVFDLIEIWRLDCNPDASDPHSWYKNIVGFAESVFRESPRSYEQIHCNPYTTLLEYGLESEVASKLTAAWHYLSNSNEIPSPSQTEVK